MNPDTQRLDPGFDPRIADWLEADPDRAPHEVVDTILAALPSVQQRPVIRGPWRLPIVLTPTRAAMAALLGVLLIGGTLLALQGPHRSDVAKPTPLPSVLPLATLVPPTAAPSTAVVTVAPTPTPAPTPELIAFETSAFTSPSSDTVRVEREDGSDVHELLPDIRSSHLIGRIPDGDQVLVTFDGDERLMALVDLTDGQIHPVPMDCPSADCWADSANLFGSGRHGVSLSSDGRQAAMVLSNTAGRTEVIAIVDLATGSTSVVESTRVRGSGLSDPRLSPDGRTIAYVLLEARRDPGKCDFKAMALMVVDRFDGSAPRRLVSTDRCPSDPAWSPSGADIALTSDDATNTPGSSPGELIRHEHHDVYVVSVKGGKVRRLTTDRRSSNAAWTADGRISYAVIRDNAEHNGSVVDVWIVDPDTGHRTRLKRTLRALGDAGCRSCAFLWLNDSGSSFDVIGLWP